MAFSSLKEMKTFSIFNEKLEFPAAAKKHQRNLLFISAYRCGNIPTNYNTVAIMTSRQKKQADDGT